MANDLLGTYPPSLPENREAEREFWDRVDDEADTVLSEKPPQVSDKPENVLEEAARITSGDRNQAYGHPLDNHSRTAGLWSAYLGVEITPRDVCWLNVLQKASRDVNKEGRDNLVDAAGYVRNAEMIDEEIARRQDG